MKVTVYGSGYVGLVTGACLAEMGNHVLCLDVDAERIALLKDGGLPLHEPGLEPLMQRNAAAGRLEFTTDLDQAVHHGTLQFIAVGTPSAENGSVDLRHVMQVVHAIGERMTDYKVIVDKSTVPVGTADAVQAAIHKLLETRSIEVGFSVVANPEFLKEGAAVGDFMRPDRVVIGTSDERAIHLMRALYSPFLRNRDRLLVMDRRSAELTKYAANAMLATRISFMNELAALSERLGADIELVRQGVGSDSRIGTQFLYPGCGYGGSCFPKDVRALVNMGQGVGVDMGILRAVESVNDRQKQVLLDKIVERFGPDLSERRFAVWGLAFKPGTDDMREAPSLVVIKGLTQRGATVCAYDPVAVDEARRHMHGWPNVEYGSTSEAAARGADALVIVTEWREFRGVDLSGLARQLKCPVVFDGRNIFDTVIAAEAGLELHGIGRSPA